MQKDKKVIDFDLFWFVLICFDSIQIFKEIASLSFQVSWGQQFLTEVKKIQVLGIFWLGLSNFGWFAWFPFDKRQPNGKQLNIAQNLYTKNCHWIKWINTNYRYTIFRYLRLYQNVLRFQDPENAKICHKWTKKSCWKFVYKCG